MKTQIEKDAPVTPQPDLSRVVDLEALHPGVNRFEIVAVSEELKAVAKRVGIPSIEFLRGNFAVSRFAGGVDVSIDVEARAGRTCVASLQPMTEDVRDQFDLKFLKDFKEEPDAEEETDDILREPLEGDTLDLGELLVQHFVLALNPWPRKEDAESLAASHGTDCSSNPFEVLKGLVDDAS